MTDASNKRRKLSDAAPVKKEEVKTEEVKTTPAVLPPDAPTASEDVSTDVTRTFRDLGIVDSLVEATEALGYKHPTPIQEQSIPVALEGRDIVGLAATGSGKTAAFALPILQNLLAKPSGLYAVVLAPTRELAAQIATAFEALGSIAAVRVALVVGGLDMTAQAIALAKRPHIVVATPGRLLDHLQKTKGFHLRTLRYLVMDEADRLLDMSFGPEIDKILKFIPRERNTFLFSATMSSKVESLQRASLKDPVRVSVQSHNHEVVSTLLQSYVFIPHPMKETYLTYLCNEFSGKSTIIFSRTVHDTQRIGILLRLLGFSAIPLHGQLSQTARLGALNKFRSGTRSILVATDVAARGLDIPNVDLVINYDLPGDSKTYIHRVGRTARAGKSGRAISLVTQYDLEVYLRIEAALGKKLEQYPTEKEEVMVFQPRVEEASRHARIEMKQIMESGKNKKGPGGKSKGVGKRRHDDMDAEEG